MISLRRALNWNSNVLLAWQMVEMSELGTALDELSRERRKVYELTIERDKFSESLKRLVWAVEKYAEGGLIENYSSDRGMSLSDVVDDAIESLAAIDGGRNG